MYDGGYGIVVESSGHKRTVDAAAAVLELRQVYAADPFLGTPFDFTTVTLFSHLRSVEPWCFCADPDNQWCADGNGSAWSRVLMPATSVPFTGDCPICQPEPEEPYSGPGVPVKVAGVRHRQKCPTLPRLSTEDEEALKKSFDDISKAKRRAWEASQGIVLP